MSTDPIQTSFGQYLRAARIEKGISLEAVASATCVSIEVLHHIEDENTAKLPADVFVKGFLRAYAAEVGADGDLAVASYLASRTPAGCTPVADSSPCGLEPAPGNRRFWIQLFAAFLGLAIIIGVSLVIIDPPSAPVAQTSAQPGAQAAASRAQNTPDRTHADRLQGGQPAAAGERPSTVEPSALPPTVLPSAPADKPYRLEMRATENTWVKIIIDDQPPRQVPLKVGERVEVEARNGFNLLIGNAAGVRLSLNGEGVPVPGREGQVVTLKLP